jgi:hypothetical protein
MLSIELHHLSTVRHRFGCTNAADMSTVVLEMLSIELHALSAARYGNVRTSAADMSRYSSVRDDVAVGWIPLSTARYRDLCTTAADTGSHAQSIV